MISRSLLRTKILQTLYAHFNTGRGDVLKPEKDLEHSVQKTYNLYLHLLSLPVAVKNYAETRIDLALNKKLPTYEDLNPNKRFVENAVIKQINNDEDFKKCISKHVLSWKENPDLIKNLYNNMTESKYYKNYMEMDSTTFEDDKRLVMSFYNNELENYELFLDVLEERSIFWCNDIGFIVSLASKTIKDMTEEKFEVLPLYKSEDDRQFAFSLLQKTLYHYDEYHKLISEFIENWDIERVAHIDNIILQMAVNELVNFPTIPTNVTFDEYLELAKYYSTPKSSSFINGLLDKLYEDLTAKGIIVKIGNLGERRKPEKDDVGQNEIDTENIEENIEELSENLENQIVQEDK
jgi:N utilization substance protein B